MLMGLLLWLFLRYGGELGRVETNSESHYYLMLVGLEKLLFLGD